MYRNQKDVDKHVDSLLKKLSPKEFKSRAYSIARLYYDVGDYSSCMKYASEYLTVYNNAAVHKLLGQTHQKLGNKDAALDHYTISFEIDSTQTGLILDICDLLADNQVEMNPRLATKWCDKAQAVFPRHPTTFKLRERLVTFNKSDPEAVIQLLKTELAENPKDAFLHARLLKHYLNSNKIKDAFEHSFNVEFETNAFRNNFAWYESLVDISNQNTLKMNDWNFQLYLLTIRERICYLSIAETPSGTSKSIVETNEFLNLYDQAIESVVKAGSPPGYAEFHLGLIQHHKGQLAFHIATYLLKKAKKDQLNWRDATHLAAPLFLVSWQTVPVDPKVNWLSHAPEKQKEAALRWYLEGSYRCSQSGHYLISNVKDKLQSFLDNISQYCSDTNWRDKLYVKVFTSKESLAKSKTSFLVSKAFNAPVIRLPRKSEVTAYDADAQKYFSNSLHHIVWTLLNYPDFSQFQCSLFQMLKPSSSNNGPESLNKLDIDAFLYCTALMANQKKSAEAHLAYNKPCVLPASITELYCTLPQMKWWVIAVKFAQNELGSDWTDVRTTLGRGIEVVRCLDNHGLDPELLCKLGSIFNERAKRATDASEKIDLENKAATYYNEAIPLLEKLKNKIFVKVPEKRMFDYTHKDLGDKELTTLLQEAKLCVALKCFNDSDYEKTIEMLSTLKTPQAHYYLAKTFMKIASEELSSSSYDKLKCSSLLAKAKSYADKAYYKLKNIEGNDMCLDLQELIEAIDIQLEKNNNADSSGNNMHDLESDNSPDEHYYSVNTTTQRTFPTGRNISSTPKQNNNANNTKYRSIIDSNVMENNHVDYQFLERIENQIKSLQRRETTINDFMDHTREWFEENRKLGNQIMNSIQSNMQNTTDQFKLLKVSVDHIRDQLDECKSECKDVSDLKKQIAELKKEVNKLKKTSSEQTINDSDLYNLEEDYRTNENNINLPFNPTQVMSTFNQRLLPTFPMPHNPYQLYGQNMCNLYNQFSQFAQPAAVPAAPQVFDPSRTPVNYTGVYPTPEQLYLDVAHLVPPPVQPPTSVPVLPIIPPVPAHPIVSAATMPVVSKPIVAPLAVNLPKPVSLDSREINRSLPVNVVITSSDPLPSCITTTPAPVLSVTIPPKHIKGTTPHNYQIQLPSSDEKGNSPSMFNTPAVIKSMSSSSSATINWNPVTIFQSKPSENNSQPLQSSPIRIPKQLEVSVVDGTYSANTSLNKSRTLSEKSNTSVENYDPCPDFKPIVPLPAEVKVTTGEEDEIVVFSARAKLFRFVNKEWKERGLGDMKLLRHKTTGKVRVLMRREQIHKICANHIITSDIEIKPMLNETKAYFWVANDFADETVVLEKFCARFKTAEVAKSFYDEFEKARKESSNSPQPKQSMAKPTSNIPAVNLNVEQGNVAQKPVFTGFKFNTSEAKNSSDTNNENNTTAASKPVIGGFTFSSAPNFKPVVDEKSPSTVTQQESSAANKLNVFNNLTFKTNNVQSPFSNLFNKPANQEAPALATPVTENAKPNLNSSNLNTSDTIEEFEPNVDFKPVVPLPALIDQKTGEEDEIVLFEHRAKLLRFDTTTKEWKERGLGNIKLLMHKDVPQKVRLLMRREQIMKVCCNHVISKDMVFQKMPNADKAVTWCAKDFAEGELVAETFCLRFKTVQACDNFVEAVKSVQVKLKDESKAAKEVENAAKQSSQVGFGDKFKPKAGSWHCDACYTNNLENFLKCACCEQPKPGAPDSNAPKATVSTPSWGDKFKPKAGSWECQQCFIRNDSTVDTCVACNSAKDPSKPKAQNVSASDNAPKFNFGIPAQNKIQAPITTSAPPAASAASSWGDQFKAPKGSWECKQCLVRNEGSLQKCSACAASKDPESKPNNSSSVAVSQDKPFSFGVPVITSSEEKPKTDGDSIFAHTGPHKFRFGIPQAPESNVTKTAPFSGSIFASPAAPKTDTPVNFSLNKNNETKAVEFKPALLSTPTTTSQTAILGNKNDSGFGFVFKPKTPPSSKSPGKLDRSGTGDDNDEYASEDEGHHIHFDPIIPLPDKVEVVTGEENEDELYGHRAKLFIFTSGEWKERGLGIVKILQHKENKKLRVVMRREQVLKICLNHSLTGDITYTSKDDKTWLFAANDFSEGELNLQQFCLRFKTKEIAQDFKNAIDNALGGKSDPQINKTDNKDNVSDDVVFVSETQASVEDKKKAKDLMLPENFFTYKDKDPCQGCRGCNDNDDEVPPSKPNPLISKVLSTATSTPVKFSSPVLSQASSTNDNPANGDKTFMGDTSVYRTPLSSTWGFLNSNKTPSNNSTVSSTTSDNTDKENSVLPKMNIFQSAQKSLFGSPQSGIFGTPQSRTSTASEETKSSDPKSVFGSINQKPTNSVFGSALQGSIFGSNNTSLKTPFGLPVDAKKEDQKPVVKSIFGTDSHKPTNVFGAQSSIIGPGGSTNSQAKAPGESIFGTVKFGAAAQPKPEIKSETKPEPQEPLFKVDNNLSFSALATGGSSFKKNEDFKWEGEGQQLFGGAKKSADESGGGGGNEGAAADEEYDPHYEPIVPLPDKIVVTTGEEDEVKEFSQRCKLFRFDEKTKEWKERGVGELKILYHPEKKTYRLLLRREQIHKAVLNMLLHMDLELLPMKNSESAWTWAGRNYAESAAGEQETLAVRFKNSALAQAFHEKATECIRKLQSAAARSTWEGSTGVVPLRLPKHLQDTARADSDLSHIVAQHTQAVTSHTTTSVDTTVTSHTSADTNAGSSVEVKEVTAEVKDAEQDEDEDEYDNEYEHNEEYDYYNEEEEESATYYSCESAVVVKSQSGFEVSCDPALVQVSFDPEIYSPKILITDPATGEILADMLIHTETEFKMTDDVTCTWSGADYTTGDAAEKTVTVAFPDVDTAAGFYDSCETSKMATYSSTDP